ncbi:MAG: hypothetical protein LBU88_10625, partial [Treponema sp.]|nr:hypothetical protein [Treponema sp.]
WRKYLKLDSIYEVTFFVEAAFDDIGNGYLDLTYLYLSQETNRRNIPAGTTPVDYDDGGEPVVGLYGAYNNNPNMGLSSSVNYQIVNLPNDANRTNVFKVTNPAEWAVALYDLSAYKNKRITINFTAQIKRVGAAGTLNWTINNSDYPSASRIENATAGIWHSMSGTWTGTPATEYPAFVLDTYENNSANTIYYIDNFNITITE